MTDTPERQAVALFRYGLIAEFLQWPADRPGLYAQLRAKAAADHTIPGSTRTRVAPETLRHWLRAYRRGGFAALLPKGRSDRGQSRALPPAVAEALVNLKDEQPELDEPSSLDRRRFAFAAAGQLWMSDVMHGPTVAVPGRGRRKTYLLAFLDDATRVIPYCAFALAENTQAFLPLFKQALLRRGIPQRLYVDNGANFRSQQLALVCAKLGVALIHARPYQPQGKGKMERWFRTVRAQLVSRLTAADTVDLDTLNRRLWAWVEGEYHQTPHRGLDGQTPLDRWAATGAAVRLPGPDLDLDALFLFETKRRVQRDRTISLHGTLFEVDAALVGQTVILRYDPSAPPARGIEVWHDGHFVARATPLDAYANCFVRRHRPTQNLDPDSPPDTPRASGLALHQLRDDRKPR